jgi:hypothetical protein
VNFGSKAQTETLTLRDGTKRAGPANRRAEMWMRSKEWLEQTGGSDIPDSDALQSDACAPGYSYGTTDQRLVLESKEQMRARRTVERSLARSPWAPARTICGLAACGPQTNGMPWF